MTLHMTCILKFSRTPQHDLVGWISAHTKCSNSQLESGGRDSLVLVLLGTAHFDTSYVSIHSDQPKFRFIHRMCNLENSWIDIIRHGKGPPSPQPKVSTNGQKHDFSNLYKELGYDSTHNFDIIARSLYSLGARKAFSKITTLIG